MKRILAAGWLLTAFALLLPLAVGAGAQPFPTQTPAPDVPAASLSAGESDSAHMVSLLLHGEVVTLSMYDYLQGVVAAEMPAEFEPEALKAQAVAARTFTLYRQAGAPMSEHRGAQVCADSTHCKAYLSPEEAAARWGERAEACGEKIRAAVAATDGVALYYQDAPILAVFHSTSSGRTEAAGDVWTQDLPYLQSVESPGEEASPRYYGELTLTPEEFQAAVLSAWPEADLSGAVEDWCSQPVRSQGGAVTSMEIGGVTVTGGELRQVFSLQSANLTITPGEDAITITTLGYGHGVGLSQYGAQAMALAGADYAAILEHYYTGVTLERK